MTERAQIWDVRQQTSASCTRVRSSRPTTLLVPFCAWLLMGYFKSVPHEPEDAARIDVPTRLQTDVRTVPVGAIAE